MEAIRFINGRYEYITNGISDDVFVRDGELGTCVGYSPEDIANDSSFILHSPIIAKLEKRTCNLYDNRIVVCSRGYQWHRQFCINIDQLFDIMGSWGKTYNGEWELSGLSPNEFIQYMNLIEEKGNPFVRDMYLELRQKELDNLLKIKDLLNEDLLIMLGNQVSIETRERIREIASKAAILATTIAKIETHKKLYH